MQERIEQLRCPRCGAQELRIRYLVREYTERRVIVDRGELQVGEPVLIGEKNGKDPLFGCADCKHTWKVPKWIQINR